MIKRISRATIRFIVVVLVLGLFLPCQQLGGRAERTDRVYRSGLMAIKNLINTQDAIRDGLETLEEEERRLRKELEKRQEEIKEEKQKYQLVSRSFQGIFPNGRRTENQTRNFLKNLRNIGPEESPPVEKVIEEPKSNSNIVKGIVVGGLLAVAALAAGVIVGKSISKSSEKGGPDNGAQFWLNTMSGYAKSKQ